MRTSLPKTKISAILTCAVIAISSVLATHNSVQAAPVANGPIFVYSQWARLLNSDSTLANAPRYLTGAPEYSHDGTKMAWVEGKNGGSIIKISNINGTSVKTLLDSSIQFEKLKFTSTNQLILFDDNSPTLHSIDSSAENQTLSTANVFLTLNSGSFSDISVSSNDKLAYVNNAACPDLNNATNLSGIFTRDINGTGVGIFVSESCTNPLTGLRRESRIVQWNAAGTALFVGHSEYITSTQVDQRIVLINPGVSRTSIALVGTETTNSSYNFGYSPYNISVSPDETKLALLTLSQPSWTFKLWTLNSDGTGLSQSSVIPTFGAMTWARPITLDAIPTTSGAPTTSLAPTTPAATPTNDYATAVPGITVTDSKIYQSAPKEVAGESAIVVLTPAQNKIADVVSKTPSVCLPSDNNLVFINEGRCVAEVINVKTRKVLRTLKTVVVSDDISEIKVGNEIAILTPLYFVAASFDLKPQSLSRLTQLKDKVTAAGSVLVAGHSGVLMGNTPENVKLAKARAEAAVRILKARGAKGPFAIASVGALDPATSIRTQVAQDKNRRVVIILIP